MNEQFYYCKRMRLMSYLAKNELYPIEVLREPANPKMFVWKYERTAEFNALLENYFENETLTAKRQGGTR